MAGNARGKLKEECEGIHTNLDWAGYHCQKAEAILGETHPELHELFSGIRTLLTEIDNQLAVIYSKL